MTTTATRSEDQQLGLDEVLLARRGAVYLTRRENPAPTPSTAPASPGAASDDGLVLLESDLLQLGYLLSGQLRTQLAALTPGDLADTGASLLAALTEAVGAARHHTPLFRKFPDNVPSDTLQLFLDRVTVALGQSEELPCVLCASTKPVQALSGCGHLICTDCFSPADYAACPICYRALDPADPYLAAGTAATATDNSSSRQQARRNKPLTVPNRLRVLHAGHDRDADAAAELRVLLERPTSLSGTDMTHLPALLQATPAGDVSWLPLTIPGRATKAQVLAWLLLDTDTDKVRSGPAETLAAVADRIDTARDVRRLLSVLSGGDAELLTAVKFTSVPRGLRRALLGALERECVAGKQDLVADDIHRDARVWKSIGHVLHPFESASRYPHVAAVFASLRETNLAAAGDLSSHVAVSGDALSLTPAGDGLQTVRFTSWRSQVDDALARTDIDAALALLAQRPGELGRALLHVLTLSCSTDGSSNDRVLEAWRTAVASVSPAVLCAVLGATRARASGATRRVYFPKGGAARIHVEAETRSLLPDHVLADVEQTVLDELVRRAALLPPARVAYVDAGLSRVVAPFGERTASRSLVTLPRGSVMDLPAASKVRLFVHWMENDAAAGGPAGVYDSRVDLDLSAALFDATWALRDTCSYVNLTVAGGLNLPPAAVHSGDYTSAPAPLGASEFIDLDLQLLAAQGIRYVVATVHSYNSVAFDDMAEAFSGVMALPAGHQPEAGRSHASPFDASGVEQRLDMTGSHKMHVPLLIDVEARTWMWLDAAQGVSGEVHAVWNTSDQLAVMGSSLLELFGSGARVSLGEVALLQAACRADDVVVRPGGRGATGFVSHARPGGSESRDIRFVRRADEPRAAFVERVRAGVQSDGPGDAAAVPDLVFTVSADVAVADGAEVFALYPGYLSAESVTLVSAADVAGKLTDPAR